MGNLQCYYLVCKTNRNGMMTGELDVFSSKSGSLSFSFFYFVALHLKRTIYAQS